MFLVHMKLEKNVNIICELVTFMAMMRKKNINNTTIDPSEVFEYLFNSWIYGFRILSDNITRDKSSTAF
jgi:hypothetical protein